MRLTGILIAIGCSLVLFAACKKSDNSSPTREKLMAGKWQISGSMATVNDNGKDTTIDYYSQWRTCEQDDIMEFSDDGNCTTNENTEKCPEDDQVQHFTWELQNNDTKLVLKGNNIVFSSTGSKTATFELLEVTDTQLKLKAEGNISSKPAVMIETYKNIR